MKILLTGGSGRLGTELQKIRKFTYAPSRSDLNVADILSVSSYPHRDFDLVVHLAALTNVKESEVKKRDYYVTNVVGTSNVTVFGKPILYLSSDYVFDGTKGDYNEWDYPNPKSYYALTKYLGERLVLWNSKVIRAGFRPRPFPYPEAYTDQLTTADYVDVIAAEISKAIDLYEVLPQITHIGTEKKTMYDLAKRSNPDVKPITGSPHKDVSLNTDNWKRVRDGV